MAFEPTNQQKQAIYCSSGTLVSAAAGSGKTAVLVERVIDKICGENAVPADRLLVVTFTKAAAEEMRGRIEKRLSEEYSKNPENQFLIEQRIKLRNAKICTIDSFCIDLIRENFDRLGISPDFAIADDAVLMPLSQMAISAVIDEAFEKGTQEFSALIDGVSSDFDEGDLSKYIKSIYNFSQNMPFPEQWLLDLQARSQTSEFFTFLTDTAFSYAHELLNTYANNLYSAISQLGALEGVLDKYQPVLSQCADDLFIIAKYCKEKNWNKVCELVANFESGSLSTPRGFADDPLVISAREIRNSAKAAVADLSELFSSNDESLKKDYNDSYVLINEIISLTLEYMRVFKGLRKEKNVMTFSDTTHAALELLCKNVGGEIVRTEFADEIIGRFDEVLVDEFQDTNDMQDLLFYLISNEEKNIFIVGDIKQSIYRFRGANPNNFMKKKQRYLPFDSATNGELKKIILSSNFRSRHQICDFVNLIFGAVMNGKLSSVAYNNEEQLNPEAKFPENSANSVEIKLTNIATATEKWVAEANSIADYIEKSMANELVTDDETKKLRRPRYQDFTILFRSIKKAGPVYAEVLKQRGIPVSLQKNDFLENTEIQTAFSFLRAIENPTLDIPLAAVMMSPVFCFSAEEMANIRLTNRKCSLISAVTQSAVAGEKKCADFLKVLKRLRNQFSTSSISETINYLYNQTDLLNIMSVLQNGDNRRRNLLLLESMAAEYDANGFSKRVEFFIKHIEKLAQKGIDSVSAGQDAVSLMTIHSSKGLQFPICIIADTSSSFNTKDLTSKLLINSELGISFKVNEDDGGSQKSVITRNIISVAAKQEQLDEEMRLLYVALTRAKEKLIICITEKDVLKRAMGYAVPIMHYKNLEDYRNSVTEMNSYADMLWFALMSDKNMQDFVLSDVENCTYFTKGEYDISFSNYQAKESEQDTVEQVEEQEVAYDKQLGLAIKENINYVYEYEQLKEIESKSAVAIIAHKAEEKDFSFTSRPAFMSKGGLSPAARGTATHRFMQFADFAKAKKDLAAEIDRLYEWEFITYNEKQAIQKDTVERFFESGLFRRIQKSEKVSREMRFLTEIPAGELNPTLDNTLANEMVVVQGSVDCVFVEDDSIVVVDFKTDRVNTVNDLADAYAKQLEMYAAACQKIFRLPIKQKIIYSFFLSKEIEV